MKKLLLLAQLLLCSYVTFASHIVGGEFELRHLGTSNFKLSLHLYSDDINGNPAAIDPYAMVYIFRKSDNFRMETGIRLNKYTTVPVNYSNIECQDQRLKTSHITYEANIYLDPSKYNDPQGYYVAYERCCRNRTVVNIREPEATGQTFYLEFPPVTKLNSSPRLFPPLSDYACVGTPFLFNFAATDPDKDSLVYSLVTPLRGASSPNDPAPFVTPAPYQLVSWLPGYSETYQVSGTQPLQIGRNSGELSLIPDKVGLYVFAVKCEEYRNGEKIGEVRREFQLMVLDCPKNDKPAISFTNPSTNLPYVPGDTILLTSNQHQFDFTVKDPDLADKLKIEARGFNLKGTRIALSLTSGTVNSSTNPSDSLNSSLQLSIDDMQCAEPFSVRLTAKDNACSVPASDALTIHFKFAESQNRAPQLTVRKPSDTIVVVINKDQVAFEVSGIDPDAHQVQIKAEVNGKNPSEYGINFPPLEAMAEVNGLFSWRPGCSALTPGEYQVNFIINDVMCRPDNFDTVSVVIKVMEDNAPANIYASDTLDLTKPLKVQMGSKIQFKLFGEDADVTDQLLLAAKGTGFELADVGMVFPGAEGNSLINSTFEWNSSCEHQDYLNKPLEVEFTLREQVCNSTYEQKLVVTLELIDTVAKDQMPYNVITPNGDGKNEYFSLDNITLETCIGGFEFVEVYNRWGNLVFKDTVKGFKWEPEKFSPGVYFYYIKFQNRDFKGWVSLLK